MQLHLPELELQPGASVLNPALDWGNIEQRFNEATPRVVVIDDLLSSEALEALLRYCEEATIWHDVHQVDS